MSPIAIAIIGSIAGLIVGSGITAWLVKRPGNPTSPAALKEEMDGYKEEVAEHFAQTAALVDKMTDSYKDVFDHLQGGASKLIGEEKLREKLADQSSEVITLNRLGSAGGASAAATEAPDSSAQAQTEEATRAVAESTESDTATAAEASNPAEPVEGNETVADADSTAESEHNTDEPVTPPPAAHS